MGSKIPLWDVENASEHDLNIENIVMTSNSLIRAIPISLILILF